jgi:hypothetical protein
MKDTPHSKTLRRLAKGGKTLDVRKERPQSVRWVPGQAAYRLCRQEGIPFLGAYVGAGSGSRGLDGVVVEARDEARILAQLARCDLHSRYFRELLRVRYPSLPAACEEEIVSMACKAGGDAVGRPDAGVPLPVAVERAVTSHIRHQFTDYEALLADGVPREEAKACIKGTLVAVLKAWEESNST